MQPDARPQAWKNRRCIRWNTLRIFSGRERRRWLRIVRRRRKVNVEQAPKPHAITQEIGFCHLIPAERSHCPAVCPGKRSVSIVGLADDPPCPKFTADGIDVLPTFTSRQ
jgi:hypothetical protein